MLVLPRSTLIVVMMMLYMTRVILEIVDSSITFIPFQFDAKFLKFMFSKKATKFDGIFTFSVKSMVKILSIFVAFLENTNLT